MQKKFLTTDEITNGYGIDAATVQALVDSGDLKALADRGAWKYRRDEVESLIKAGRLHPTKELPVVGDEGLDETFGFASEASMPAAADFLELDEDALSEQPTIIRGRSAPDDGSDADSASDVHIVFEPTATNFSDSDIRLGSASPFAAPIPTGLPGDGPDSHIRMVPDRGDMPDVDFEDTHVFSAQQPYPDAGKTQEIELDESDALDEADRPADDQGVGNLETMSDLPTDWKEASSSDVAFAQPDEGQAEEDSGLTLDADDSGISLDAGDSGISLDIGDSGISLEAGDSGIKLAGSAPKLQQFSDPLAATENQLDFRLADDEEQPRSVLDKGDQTAVFISTDSSEETFSPTLSGALTAGEEVEDLEVSPELDDVTAEDDEFSADVLEEEEEALEVDDEDFREEIGTTGDGDDDELIAAAAGKVGVAREPNWGMPTFVLALSAALLVGTNMWLAWEGLRTMWDGSDAASVVSTIAGLM